MYVIILTFLMYVTLQVKSVMMIFLTHVNHIPLIAFTITLVNDLFVITLILTLKIDLNHALADVANHVTKMMNRTNPLTLTQTTVVAACTVHDLDRLHQQKNELLDAIPNLNQKFRPKPDTKRDNFVEELKAQVKSMSDKITSLEIQLQMEKAKKQPFTEPFPTMTKPKKYKSDKKLEKLGPHDLINVKQPSTINLTTITYTCRVLMKAKTTSPVSTKHKLSPQRNLLTHM